MSLGKGEKGSGANPYDAIERSMGGLHLFCFFL